MKILTVTSAGNESRPPLAASAAAALLLALLLPGTAHAEKPVRCDGMATLGAATLVCGQAAPKAVPRLCTFEWSLLASSGRPETVSGSFMLPTGASNVPVYRASGFTRALSPPVVLCR